MKPHKWAKEIKAWADGAEIEKWMLNDTWQIEVRPNWYDYEKYRIKPQSKEPQYLYAYQGKNQIWFSRHNHSNELNNCIGKIKLEDV